MTEECETPFQRCHFEPCTFTHFLDGEVDEHGAPRRIICSVYVDDGRTWDNCAAVCDGFYERLKKRFSITMDAGTHFMIGMDIDFGEGWLKISSSTYIMNMCEKWLDFPIAEYDHVGTPSSRTRAYRRRHPAASLSPRSSQRPQHITAIPSQSQTTTHVLRPDTPNYTRYNPTSTPSLPHSWPCDTYPNTYSYPGADDGSADRREGQPRALRRVHPDRS